METGEAGADLAEAGPEHAEELGAALAGAVELQRGEPLGALGGGETGERDELGAGGGRETVECGLADVAETLAGGDGVGRAEKAGAGVERVAAVAGGIGADGVDPLGEIGAAGVVVEVAALGQGVEQGVELRGSGAGHEGVEARGEIGGVGGGGEDQADEEATHGINSRTGKS